MSSVVIVAAKRTPVGAFQGILSGVSATELGANAIRAAVESAGLGTHDVSDVIMGCVLPAGTGQSPARQALLKAGLSQHTTALTVNKVCGSGLKAVMLGHDLIKAGSATTVVAGGMENMNAAPYLLTKARGGYRMGHAEIFDHMLYDGLQDAYAGVAMGVYADATAKEKGFSREDQDAFAILSATRALEAIKSGAFVEEISPIEIADRKGAILVAQDEPPSKVNIDKIPTLRPAFTKDGTVTAANASSISDGGAALVLMEESAATTKPLARIVGHASHSHEPEWFTLAPIGAVKKLLTQVGWHKDEVDLFEINEAFAVVTLAAIKELALDPSKVNVHGGACALGHPIGASGARILVTLIHALKQKGGKRGIATLCIGGGEAVAVAIEML
ncbi:MAG: acetyl-CoA C-acyltransferase [Candidatus Puniceispirillum sp.]|nr:acetyl-CoA C-acyltransferase [Candidatus Puniceispirillum sp.]